MERKSETTVKISFVKLHIHVTQNEPGTPITIS